MSSLVFYLLVPLVKSKRLCQLSWVAITFILPFYRSIHTLGQTCMHILVFVDSKGHGVCSNDRPQSYKNMQLFQIKQNYVSLIWSTFSDSSCTQITPMEWIKRTRIDVIIFCKKSPREIMWIFLIEKWLCVNEDTLNIFSCDVFNCSSFTGMWGFLN